MSNAQYPQLNGPFTLRQQYIGQPARAHRVATQIVLNSIAYQQLALGAVTFDPYGSSFNLASNTFVAPASGYYAVSANILAAGSITTLLTAVCKNGNGNEIFRLGHQNNLGGKMLLVQGGSDFVYLNQNDSLDVECVILGAATMSLGGVGTNACFLSAMQLA